jgi:hypothetical protein|tara:strand:+ start:282 stop:452 length:171 start_codon:yes stop_codon:yes gene_type:complete
MASIASAEGPMNAMPSSWWKEVSGIGNRKEENEENEGIQTTQVKGTDGEKRKRGVE